MRRAILLHGWEENPSSHWLPWLAKTLRKDGWRVETPEMPDTKNPKFDDWLNKLHSLSPDEHTILVGHSLANALILKYLEDPKTKIMGAVLVAAWDWLMEDIREFHETFFQGGFNYGLIKKKGVPIVIVNSTNDPWIDFHRSKELTTKVGATFVPIENAGHFREKDGYKEFPQLTAIIREYFGVKK